MSEYVRKIDAAAAYLKEKIGFTPRVGLVLGSGWGELISDVKGAVEVPFGDVPGMAKSTVAGHAGKWIFGDVNGQKVAIMSGRLHFYEGHAMKDVTFPTRVMKKLGVEILVLTNASGAVNTGFLPGDLMLITDHINLSGQNPLIGPNEDELGDRFPDMTNLYDPALQALARNVSADIHFPIREGVYAFLTGPSYETPAEIRMMRILGADAVGMSTVPEAIVARHGGMRVLGLSCATNMAAGILDQPLAHKEVLETAQRVAPAYRAFLYELMGRL